MDWDMVVTPRSALDGPVVAQSGLLNAPVVFGAEKKIVNFKEVLGVAFIASRPNSIWMKRYLELMYERVT